MFTASFKTDNPAYGYGSREDLVEATILTLKHIIESLEQGITEKNILDENGNPVGEWSLTE